MKRFYFLLLCFLTCCVGNAQIIEFSDYVFKYELVHADVDDNVARDINGNPMKIDVNDDGEIQLTEAAAVYQLDVTQQQITDMTGIKFFTNLKFLKTTDNDLINLDVSGMVNLENLWCSDNFSIESINLDGLVNLKELLCSGNEINTLDLTGLTNLEVLDCGGNNLLQLNCNMLQHLEVIQCASNPLSSVDLNGMQALMEFNCSYTPSVTALDFSNCPMLSKIYVANNSISYLNIQNCPSITELACSNNFIASLDLSMCEGLQKLACSVNTPLQYLNIKNGSHEPINQLNIAYNNPNLQYICADESQLTELTAYLEFYESEAVLNSYCSFVPGGTYYMVNGNARLDIDDNGCDIFDNPAQNIKFNVAGATSSTTTFSNALGEYQIALQEGSYTFSAALGDIPYFNISPTTFTVDFPASVSPNTNHFCLTPNGVHPDLEIVIIPVSAARPGFDTFYKIIYRNKGTQTDSGTVNLNFDDTVFDFVEANPTVNSQTEYNLTWDYYDLKPFESRVIYLKMNLNSPTEVPAVVGGEVLFFTANITSPETDEVQNDNISTLYQTVVNSFDPNDKTCVEGENLPPELAGTYVHYVIRFENTGTANAVNIVVKDVIDTAKFDVNSLISLDGSHPFTTRITNTNKVEFVFENIQLPFDDANNDGYVAFKIKTLPTLVAGSIFSNTASIYFDYNAPIVTNTATTTLQVLGTEDFEFGNYFALHPNPAKDVLNIKAKQNLKLLSVSIYNMLGQLVLTVPNAADRMDVSGLLSGNYFIKIYTEKGQTSSRFIKE